MIGFFDSGMGGLTILNAVKKRLPQLETAYLGDTEHAPYGNRPREEILELTWNGCERLFARGCSLIIIACNTASANALREIQQKRLSTYPGKNVIGIVRPTVEELSRRGYRSIAVLSTKATKASGAYEAEFAKFDPRLAVVSHACPNWVGFVEDGHVDSAECADDVRREIAALEREAPGMDAILLGCTHYPYLIERIRASLTKDIPVIDQGPIVAEALADYLQRHPEYR
ncbi:MAG TPA: glutamate racemase [Verrucomicrobiae bacterium]|nr:glutamate racemase [Verrucomicrobiae bacterium]